MLDQLRKLRKPMRAISLAIGAAGIVLSWILILIFYSAIDSLENTLDDQIKAATNTVLAVENTVDSVGTELNSTRKTLSELETSLGSLEIALNDAGDASTNLGNGLKLVSIGPIGLGSYGDDFVSTGTSLKTSASSMGRTARSIEPHEANIADTSTRIDEISDSLRIQRLKLGKIKDSIVSLFSSLKLAILLLVLLMDMAFVMLGLNSIAGLLD